VTPQPLASGPQPTTPSPAPGPYAEPEVAASELAGSELGRTAETASWSSTTSSANANLRP
jgi:hypothetical protein